MKPNDALQRTGGHRGRRNVEIKARVRDLAEAEVQAGRIATEGPSDIAQDDTLFSCATGRLKLREFSSEHGELIFYSRPNDAGPKISDYWISRTDSPAAMRETLWRALGIVGRVRKIRCPRCLR